MALTVHEDGLHSCGHPRSLAFEDYNEGIFEVREEVCQACAAREQWQQSQDGKAQPHGRVIGVANTLRVGEDFRIWGSPPKRGVQPDGGQGDPEQADEHRGLGHPSALGDAAVDD